MVKVKISFISANDAVLLAVEAPRAFDAIVKIKG